MTWKPGESGNPLGRPKGSRDKLSERFFAQVAEDWAKHGADVIAHLRETTPSVYLQVVSRLLPTSHEFSISHVRDVDVSAEPLSIEAWKKQHVIEGQSDEIVESVA